MILLRWGYFALRTNSNYKMSLINSLCPVAFSSAGNTFLFPYQSTSSFPSWFSFKLPSVTLLCKQSLLRMCQTQSIFPFTYAFNEPFLLSYPPQFFLIVHHSHSFYVFHFSIPSINRYFFFHMVNVPKPFKISPFTKHLTNLFTKILQISSVETSSHTFFNAHFTSRKFFLLFSQ